MTLDLIALVVLTLFVALGAWRGAIASASGVVTLVLGYATGLWAAQAYGGPLAQQAGIPSVFGPPLAGSLAFGVVSLVGGLAGKGLRAWDDRRRGELPRSGVDRAIGGLFGALRGGLVVLLVAWLALWADAGRRLSHGERLAAAPDTESSLVAGAAGAAIGKAVEVALDDGEGGTSARVAARMASSPAEALEAVRELAEDDRIRAIQEDRLFWTYVSNGAVDSALNRASFWRAIQDDGLREQLGDLGLVGPEAVSDPRVFREAAGEVLTELGPRIKNLSEDEEIQELAKNPQIIAMLEAGDTMGLMTHPDVQRIVARISQGM
ncbi:MAG: CvpA family protein [Myxococcota bacterium]